MASDFMSKLRGVSPLLLLTVVAPTLLSGIYYSFVASDVYVSESQFVVKNPSKSGSAGGLASMLQGSNQGDSEGYQIGAYLRSRDALAGLEKVIDIKSAYGGRGDWISKYHASWDNTFESLWRYYKRDIVKVVIDSDSSIITLTVNSYEPSTSLMINQQLLNQGEQMVNEMNARAEHDAVDLAIRHVKDSEANAEAANVRLADYRGKIRLFNPERQSDLKMKALAELQGKLFDAETRLSQLQIVAPLSPQVTTVKNEVASYKSDIALVTERVAGGANSLNEQNIEFMKLQMQTDFAARQLGASLGILENARLDASRKKLYVERIVSPNLPDEAIEPRRIRNVVTIFISGLLLYATLSLLLASIREHKD